MIFSEWVPNQDTQYNMGWVFIILLSSVFFINIIFILNSLYTASKLLIIKWWRRFIAWLRRICRKKPVAPEPLPPPFPPPTPPPKFKVDSYQPMVNALKGGKTVSMVDEENKEVERIMINKENEILDDDNWKHQAAPAEIYRPDDWNDIPAAPPRMVILSSNDSSSETSSSVTSSKVASEQTSKQILSRVLGRGTTLNKIMEEDEGQSSSAIEPSTNSIPEIHIEDQKASFTKDEIELPEVEPENSASIRALQRLFKHQRSPKVSALYQDKIRKVNFEEDSDDSDDNSLNYSRNPDPENERKTQAPGTHDEKDFENPFRDERNV
jgi:hypothetical protein